MKTLTFKTSRELKHGLKASTIQTINGIDMKCLSPYISNKHVMAYVSSTWVYINAPFLVTLRSSKKNS